MQLLVREPYGVLQSFSKVLQPTQQELGYTVGLTARHMHARSFHGACMHLCRLRAWQAAVPCCHWAEG